MQNDPSLSSYYVGNQFYETLVKSYTNWQTEESEILDPILRDCCRMLIEKEARLLDQNNLDDWLNLFIPECIYWVPATPNGGDPRKEIAVCFDDRRRLEDRIFRLQNEFILDNTDRFCSTFFEKFCHDFIGILGTFYLWGV